MEGLLPSALGSKMPIPAKQALGFIGTGHHQNTHLLSISQSVSYHFYGMKHAILYQRRQNGDQKRELQTSLEKWG